MTLSDQRTATALGSPAEHTHPRPDPPTPPLVNGHAQFEFGRATLVRGPTGNFINNGLVLVPPPGVRRIRAVLFLTIVLGHPSLTSIFNIAIDYVAIYVVIVIFIVIFISIFIS